MGRKKAEEVVAEEILDSVEVKEDDVVETPVEKQTPKLGDPEWTEYVLSKLTKDELVDGNPKADGLRRVAHNLLGAFKSEVVRAEVGSQEPRAWCIVNITLGDGRVVSGASDVSMSNTPREYCVFALSTAETRAEGRALRKCLLLSKVHTAEEMEKPEDDTQVEMNRVNAMKPALIHMCSSVGVDLERLAKHIFQKDLSMISHSECMKLSGLIRQYKNKEVEIPEDVKA